MTTMQRARKRPLIGISACWLHADEDRQLYNGRALLYLEQSMGEWLMSGGDALPMMIPGARRGVQTQVGPEDYADRIDGLVIQGGVDMAPESYGQRPIREEWSGDPVRDGYELDLVQACLERDRPILGICRGHQVLNVALGGSLYQDIATQVEGALNHRDQTLYHENTHKVVLEPGAVLHQLYGVRSALVNSVHHQAIRELGDGLCVEARSSEDGVIEAVRLDGELYAVGVQWHPEFQEPWQRELLATRPLLDDFLAAVAKRM